MNHPRRIQTGNKVSCSFKWTNKGHASTVMKQGKKVENETPELQFLELFIFLTRVVPSGRDRDSNAARFLSPIFNLRIYKDP